MQKFTTISSIVAPLDAVNVDTDQIIPKQFLRSIQRTGFGPYLFDEWRYLDHGELGMDCRKRPQNPDFVLNDRQYANAQILLARDNFGCGSSREHAVWALSDAGFRAVVAPSFGDIFYSNAIKNGLLPVCLTTTDVDTLFAQAGQPMTIDLAAQTATVGETVFSFTLAADDKNRLLNGLDDIAITLQYADDIRHYEKQRLRQEPWLADGSQLLS